MSDIKPLNCALHEATLQQVAKDVDTMKTAMIGNEPMGVHGLVYTVSKMEKKIEHLETWKQDVMVRAAYVAGIVGGISGLGAVFVKLLFS